MINKDETSIGINNEKHINLDGAQPVSIDLDYRALDNPPFILECRIIDHTDLKD